VTEAITGIDLVEWQLRVASGEPLPRTQAQIVMTGHAMEARLYAENPASGFLPSTGPLTHLKLPRGIRVDSGMEQGDAVTAFYDPLLAKLIAYGPTRHEAASRLAASCRAVEVWSVKTNAAFLARAVTHPDFVAGRIDTGFMARHPELVPGDVPSSAVIAQAAQALLPKGSGPWDALIGFRTGAAPQRAVAVDVGGHMYKVEPRRGDAVLWDDVLFADGLAWQFGPPRFTGVGGGTAADGVLVAPMPGMVTVLNVKHGQAVKRGETLLVLEAMKMENGLTAPCDGVIAALNVQLGEQVQEGCVLVRIDKEDA